MQLKPTHFLWIAAVVVGLVGLRWATSRRPAVEPAAPQSRIEPRTVEALPEERIATNVGGDAASATARLADPPPAEIQTGEVTQREEPGEKSLPTAFRLAPATFQYEQEPIATVSKTIEISHVRFPSPMVTDQPLNNTVHCEYFCPRGDGRRPAVVVLQILGGDFDLARFVARSLAHRGVAALFLKMPYYGPRRDPNQTARMVSLDPRQTVAGMRQAVLDIRRAATWLASRPEIDPNQLGITGISLGGITAALSASSEPRFKKVALVLAGGDIGKVAWDSPHVDKVRKYWLEKGETKETFFELMKSVDPVTFAAQLKGRKILMINARYDNVIPNECTKSLWEAIGQPEMVWLEGNHYTAMRYLFECLDRVTRFFQPDK